MVLIQTIVTVGLFKQRRDSYNASNQVLKKKQIILKPQFLKIKKNSAVTRKQERRSLLADVHLEFFIFILQFVLSSELILT